MHNRARGGLLIGCDLLFAHATRKARRGHGRALNYCVNYIVTGVYHTVVAHAKGAVDTTAVCRAAYEVERVTTVHVFFRSYLRCCVLIIFSLFWINISVEIQK